MQGNDYLSKNFKTNIRNFNTSFSFASMGGNIQVPHGNGPYYFKVHGSVYHITGSLHPAESHQRQYSQLYYLDPDEGNRERMNNPINMGCNSGIFTTISNVLHEIVENTQPPRYRNPFITCYKTMKELEINQQQHDRDDRVTVSMKIVRNTVNDDRYFLLTYLLITKTRL